MEDGRKRNICGVNGGRRGPTLPHIDRQVIVVSERAPNSSSDTLTADPLTSTTLTDRPSEPDASNESKRDVWMTTADDAATSREHDRDTTPTAGSVNEDLTGSLRHVNIPDGAVHGYYAFADQVLRPITHSALARVDTADADWESYRTVNEQFAAEVPSVATDDAVIWTTGRHLALLSKSLEPRVPDDTFLFHFWPSGWPAWDTFRTCPHAESLVRGLLGNDLLGFTIPRYRDNFLRAVDELLPRADVDRQTKRVHHDGSPTEVRAFLRGVPVDRIQRVAISNATKRSASEFRDAKGIAEDRQLVLSIDWQGNLTDVYQYLQSLERMWSNARRRREEFTFVLVGGADHPREQDQGLSASLIRHTVDELNDRFGTDEWRPVCLAESLTDGERYALYRDADVGVFGSIHDSAMPAIQEFVASQSADAGSLLLSEQLATRGRFGDGALTYSPLDGESFVHSLDESLSLSPSDRRERMETLRRRVRGYDDETWVRLITGAIDGIERRTADDSSV